MTRGRVIMRAESGRTGSTGAATLPIIDKRGLMEAVLRQAGVRLVEAGDQKRSGVAIAPNGDYLRARRIVVDNTMSQAELERHFKSAVDVLVLAGFAVQVTRDSVEARIGRAAHNDNAEVRP